MINFLLQNKRRLFNKFSGSFDLREATSNEKYRHFDFLSDFWR